MSIEKIRNQLDNHLNFLAQDEENLNLIVKVSLLYAELDELEEAQAYLNKANAIDRIACLGHQGLLHLKRGQLTHAIDNFSEALDHEDSPALRYNLGFTHFINSDLEQAIEILAPIINEEHTPEAKLLMARILHREGDLTTALTLTQNVLATTPDDEEALGIAAILHLDLDEEAHAILIAEQALALNPENYDARVVKVMTGLLTLTTTVSDVETLLEINPGDCRLWFALGNVHMSQGNVTQAHECLQKALAIYPDFYDCRIALGWCQLLSDQLDEALATYEIAANLAPDLADSWGGLALAHALKENFLRAEQLIMDAKELNKECFLAEIAEIICLNHTNPLHAHEHLVATLKNSAIPISQKLAFIIEDMENSPMQIH